MRIPRARLRKVLGDLRASKARTALVGLSIAIAVTAIGMVAGARTMVLESLDRSRDKAHFASATFLTDGFGADVIRRLRSIPEVRDAEAKRIVTARLADGRDLRLLAVDDFTRMRIARVSGEAGTWPPPTGTLSVERASVSKLGAGEGDSLRLRLPGGPARTIAIAGTAHDLASPSTNTSGVLYGYADTATLRRLGDHGLPNRLDISVDGDRDRALRAATAVRRELERSGVAVRLAAVPKPGTFWANDAVNSMVLILTVLGVVCLLMSGFLVVNIISALVTQQRRQIGVMKALGASGGATAALYLGSALLFGALALVVAIPAAAVAAQALVGYSSNLINLDPPGFTLPASGLALEIGAGVALPVAAALIPVRAGSRITVRQAITAEPGAEQPEGRIERLAARIPRLPAAVRLAITNAFRRKGRLALTLTALVLGGAIFISVLSVRSSLDATLDDAGRYRRYDAQILLEGAYPAAAVERIARATPGVRRAEAPGMATAARVLPDGSETQTFTTLGVRPRTTMIEPIVLRGRWLRPADGRALVVNTDVVKHNSSMSVGDKVRLHVGRTQSEWRIVGVVRGIMQGAVAYADRRELGRAVGEVGLARQLQVVGTRHEKSTQAELVRNVSSRLGEAGFGVGPTQTTAEKRSIDESNFSIITSFLGAMAILIAVVGGLGLMGTLSINVLERSREIGVLRAIGAGDGAVVQLVLVEALLVGVIGWVLAVPLSVPLSYLLSNAVGRQFVGTPLTYTFSAGGMLVWLGLVLVLSALAALVPGRRAARLTVRDVLVYE
jgi:putative ABC transport system permease protein